MILVTPPRRHNGWYLMAWHQHCYGKRAILTSIEKREQRKWWCCQSVVRLFFPSFFALRNFEFPAKIKKGGGKDPPDPLLLSHITGRPSKAAWVKAMRMLSRDRTPAKMEVVELGVLWPSFTQWAFLVKSIFTSKIMCPDALCQSGGVLAFEPRIWKATHTLPISLASPSCQKVSLFFWSISIECLPEEGT